MNLESLLTFLREKSKKDRRTRPSNCKSCNYDQDCFEYYNTVINDGYYCSYGYQGNTGCCMAYTDNNIGSNQQKTKLIDNIIKKQNKK
jgi:hypothetical protein